MQPAPPHTALKFLRWFCREDYLDEMEGDLIEIFEQQYAQSPAAARRKFIWTVVRHFRPDFIKAFTIGQNSTAMYQHNFKIAYRNFFKYKSTFLINLIGLSTGLACALLIFLWVQDERSVDKFHENDDRLYQVMVNFDVGEDVETLDWTPMPLGGKLRNEMPEVEYVTASYPPSNYTFPGILNKEDGKLKTKAKYVNKEFFSIFTHPLVAGDQSTVLADQNSCVISEDLAIQLHGSAAGALGKVLDYEFGSYTGEYTITGVFETMPADASLQFDVAFSFDLHVAKNPDLMRWDYNDPCLYLTLKEGANANAFERKIAGLIKENNPGSSGELFLRKYSSQYLYGNFENGVQAGGRISYVILFSVIGLFLLVIACINFMNLSTARASRRIKEIGVKKSIGARRSDLALQYLMEAVIMSFLSMALALFIIALIIPEFNYITGKQLALELKPEWLLSLAGIALFTGLLAGSYPALYLSGLSPINILKGGIIKSVSALWIRKGLVVFQFVISLMLILMVFTVARQVDFIQSKNLGYDRENVIYFNERYTDYQAFTAMKTYLEGLTGVSGVSAIRGDLTSGDRNNTPQLAWEGQVEENKVNFDDVVVTHDFFETMGIKVLEGRGFTDNLEQEQLNIVFNEAAIAVMGLEDPIGQTIDMWGHQWNIIGVVQDFHLESLYTDIKPAFFRSNNYSMNAVVKIETGKTLEVLQAVEAYHKEHNDGLPLDYQFMDDAYNQLYASEQRVSTLSKYFAVVAILISCLGLFGLAAFTAEIRLKEIGIRKILGSANSQIVMLLSKEYTKMVLIANVIGLPIGYYLISMWLDNFAFKIDLSWWFFISSGVLTLLVAWFTVGFQTFKAARVNVLETLRSE
ncbi:MAG: ABC transporter permease [Bacteroidota bacterium]